MGNIVAWSEVALELGLSSSITEEERTIIEAAISRAEGAVIRHLRYDPVQRSRTEYYPRTDMDVRGTEGFWDTEQGQAYWRQRASASSDELQVQHLPIRSITSLSVDYDGRFDTQSGAFATNQTEGTDFWPDYDGVDDDGNRLCRDGIIRSFGLWPQYPGSIKIVYTAGYTDAEFHGQKNLVNAVPVRDAVLIETIRRVRRALINKKSARLGFVPGSVVSENLGDYSYSLGGAGVSTRADSLTFGSTVLSLESIEMLQEFVHWGFEQ